MIGATGIAWHKELDEDRESLRTYRNLVIQKNAVKSKAKELFYRYRRFVRRDCGTDSAEYGQLKDRAVRAAREEKLPPKQPGTCLRNGTSDN